MKNKKRVFVMQVVPGMLMLLFFYTALSKLMDYSRFNAALSDIPYINHYAKLLTWAIPVTEIVIGGLLFHTATRRGGLLLSLLLLILFTAYLFAMIVSNIKLPCSCGGVISKMSWKQHLLFNAAFIILNTIAIIKYPSSNKESIQL